MSQISLDEPRQLIHQLLPKFKPASDISHVGNLKQFINRLPSGHQKILETSNETLSNWTRKAEVAKIEAQRPSNCSVESHLEQMEALESEKFSLAKQIRDAEKSIESLESQLLEMQQEYSSLKAFNTEINEVSEFELRLRLYRSLGVSLLDSPPNSGCNTPDEKHPIRVRVKSSNNKDIHTVTIDESGNSFFYTNYIWDLCSTE